VRQMMIQALAPGEGAAGQEQTPGGCDRTTAQPGPGRHEAQR
jgi:hypothetical protein